MLVTSESRVTFRGDSERSCESRWFTCGGRRSAMSSSTGVGFSRKDSCASVSMGNLSARPSAVGSDLDKAGTAGTAGCGGVL